MEKLTFLGIGPKIARVVIPFLIISIILSILFPGIFNFGKEMQEPFLIAGIAWLKCTPGEHLKDGALGL